MSGEIRDLLESVGIFCKEHWVLLAGGAAVLIVLRIIAAAIWRSGKSSKEELPLQNEKESLDIVTGEDISKPENGEQTEEFHQPVSALAGEGESSSQKNEPAREEEQPLRFIQEIMPVGNDMQEHAGGAECEDSKSDLDDISKCAANETKMQEKTSELQMAGRQGKEKETETVAEPANITVEVKSEGFLKDLNKMNHLQKNPLESIEIKIEKAQVTINYAAERKEFAFPQAGQASEEKEKQTTIKPGEMRDECSAEVIEQANAGEKAGKEESSAFEKRIKFGAENRNISRSGRVYTEEEIYRTIKE